MTSLSGSLGIAQSGLDVISAQLALISQNIANANTADYAVESVAQSSQTVDGAGQGVATGIALRSLDLQLQQDLLAQNGTVGALSTTQTALQSIDAVQGNVGESSDLSSLVSALQSSFSELQSDPSSQVQQESVVQNASALATQINRLGQTYTATRQAAQDNLAANITSLNTLLGSVGSLTDRIMNATAAGSSTADLENQRDAALDSLSNLVGIRYVEQQNGDITINTSGGLTLPVHGGTLSLQSSVIGADSAVELGDVPAVRLNGQDVTEALTGGSIGANIALRDTTLPTYQAELDQFSQTLSSRFSDQGLDLFTTPSGNVPTGGGMPVQAGYVGYSLSITVNPSVVANPSLVRDGTEQIAGSAAGATAFTPNTDPGQTSFGLLISRVLDYSFGDDVQAGVQQAAPASSGLGPAGTLSAPFSSSLSIGSVASALVGTQSADISQTAGAASNEQAIQLTLKGKLQATSAVDTDTELALMVKLQSSYGANAKIISTVQSLFTQLLNSVS